MLAVSCRLLDLTDGLSSTIVIVSSKTLKEKKGSSETSEFLLSGLRKPQLERMYSAETARLLPMS